VFQDIFHGSEQQTELLDSWFDTEFPYGRFHEIKNALPPFCILGFQLRSSPRRDAERRIGEQKGLLHMLTSSTNGEIGHVSSVAPGRRF
jgi:hypothetical protein